MAHSCNGGAKRTRSIGDRIPNTLLEGRLIFFVTSNLHKFNEARSVLAEYGIAVAMVKIDALEIQDDDIETIARATAADAAGKFNLPLIVEDAALFVTSLRGFPGPYSSYVYRTLGTKGILRLLDGFDERGARFRSVIAFKEPGEAPVAFQGNVEGEISWEERGSQGFGFDPIFTPSKSQLAFAEMSTEDKNKYSHRAQALRKFGRWYSTRFQRRF